MARIFTEIYPASFDSRSYIVERSRIVISGTAHVCIVSIISSTVSVERARANFYSWHLEWIYVSSCSTLNDRHDRHQTEFNQNVISNRRQFDPKENFNIDVLSAREYTVYLILMSEHQSRKIVNQRKLYYLEPSRECA